MVEYHSNHAISKGISMPGIVCAIRGGPASRPTILKSIRIATDTHLPLFFLYVINLDFLTRTSSSRVHLVSKHMHDMGEFILLTAQTQAEAEGITAAGIIRQGNVRDEIIKVSQEKKADYVILGKPQKHVEVENVFTHQRLTEFGQRIEEQSGATIIFTDVEVLHDT